VTTFADSIPFGQKALFAVEVKYSDDQARDYHGRFASSTFEDPPPPRGLGRRGGYSSSGQTNTRVGDLGEGLLIRRLGMTNLHPGRRQGALDLKLGRDAYEVKVCTTSASEYKVKMRACEVTEKVAEAKKLGLRPNTLLLVFDPGSRTAWAYSRKGIGNYRLGQGDWKFLGKMRVGSKCEYEIEVKYSPDQPRDDNGRFAGGPNGSVITPPGMSNAGPGWRESKPEAPLIFVDDRRGHPGMRLEPGSAHGLSHAWQVALKPDGRPVVEKPVAKPVETPFNEPQEWNPGGVNTRLAYTQAFRNGLGATVAFRNEKGVRVGSAAAMYNRTRIDCVGKEMMYLRNSFGGEMKRYDAHPVFNVEFTDRSHCMFQGHEDDDAVGHYQTAARLIQVTTYSDPHGNMFAPSVHGFNVSNGSLEGITRHEFGHHVHLNMISHVASADWENVYHSVGGNAFFKRHVSIYSGKNIREAFAESFSVYTHPKYREGTLPDEVERYFKRNFPRRVS
jgi:hypothetical protein